MEHGFDMQQNASKLHIPEREFWTEEAAARFLNDDGKFNIDRQTKEPLFEKIEAPLIDPINYPIVDVHELMLVLKKQFQPDYRFPRYAQLNGTVQRVGDNIDHVQHDEDDYHPRHFNGSLIPDRFRNNPDRLARIPWLIHNAKTILVAKPLLPDVELMFDHDQASTIKSDLLISAAHCLKACRSFKLRQYSIQKGYIEPSVNPEAIDGAHSFLIQRHNDLYNDFLVKRERLEDIKDYIPFSYLKEDLANEKPIDIMRTLGGIATSTPWDYTHFIRGTSNVSPQSKNLFKNPALKKALAIPFVNAA